jgi:hypothetical protein
MTDARRFQLDEITIRPGTYFNPQTEVLIVVDDSPEVDHERKRDELVDAFEVTYQPGGDPLLDDDAEEDREDDDEGLDLEELDVDELGVDTE